MAIRDALIIRFISSGVVGRRLMPPAFAALLDRRADLLVPHQQELDPVLGNQLLQQIIGPESSTACRPDRGESGSYCSR